MKVVVDGEQSEEVSWFKSLKRTVLGPLLFLCHISGLPNAMKSLDDYLLKAHKNNVNRPWNSKRRSQKSRSM